MPVSDSMSRASRLATVLCLNLVLLGGLVVVGISAHSLGVLSAAGDYLADAVGVAIALVALALAKRPSNDRRPAGYPRATTYAALANAGMLLAVVLVVGVEAIRRLVGATVAVHAWPVVIVSAAAALFMLAGAVVLGGDGDDSDDDDGDRANMRAVLLDTIGDAAAALGVALTGLVILATGGSYWLDPVVALIITGVVGYHALALLRKVVGLIRH